jgi:hypothetical protein
LENHYKALLKYPVLLKMGQIMEDLLAKVKESLKKLIPLRKNVNQDGCLWSFKPDIGQIIPIYFPWIL